MIIPSIYGPSALGWVATILTFGVILAALLILVVPIVVPFALINWAFNVLERVF